MSKKTRRKTQKLRRDEPKDKDEERKKEKKRKEIDGSWLMVELCFKGKIIFWSTWLFLLIMIFNCLYWWRVEVYVFKFNELIIMGNKLIDWLILYSFVRNTDLRFIWFNWCIRDKKS